MGSAFLVDDLKVGFLRYVSRLSTLFTQAVLFVVVTTLKGNVAVHNSGSSCFLSQLKNKKKRNV